MFRAFRWARILSTHRVTVSETHLFSGATVNDLRAGFFRNVFDTDKPLNRTSPRALGFNYDSTLSAAAGPPFFIVSGYASVGDPITGPRDTTQNTSRCTTLSHVTGAHSFKVGVEFRRTQINMTEGIASNGFFVFAPFPPSDSFASFLLGFPVVFFQGGGDMNRGLRNVDFAAYAQDEWRVTPRLTLNYGSALGSEHAVRRYSQSHELLVARASNPRCFPNAPAGLLFPGDPGVPDGIAPVYWKGLMPRLGLAWDPTGSRQDVRFARPTESSTTRSPTESAVRCRRR